ncbi:hypothetical protein B0T16DRAFT_457052 [Cercophora newfieldiana]|uniref:Uncharacterized protein n=1 Tax=Cercophora newfieldiana TaxID=92897 RepID=A0AA40CUE3_9PEZI|nr:hypothetical protein B0T16DRAFT_457052 [Cercophora newfieldiana]
MAPPVIVRTPSNRDITPPLIVRTPSNRDMTPPVIIHTPQASNTNRETTPPVIVRTPSHTTEMASGTVTTPPTIVENLTPPGPSPSPPRPTLTKSLPSSSHNIAIPRWGQESNPTIAQYRDAMAQMTIVHQRLERSERYIRILYQRLVAAEGKNAELKSQLGALGIVVGTMDDKLEDAYERIADLQEGH